MKTYWIEWKPKPGVEIAYNHRTGWTSKSARDHAALTPKEWPQGMLPHAGYETGAYEALVPRRHLRRMKMRLWFKVRTFLPLALQLDNESIQKRRPRQ